MMTIPLRQIPLQDLPNLSLPAQKICTDADVHTWKSTQGYKDYAAFVGMVNEYVVGVYMPWDDGGGEELEGCEVCMDHYF
jgi:serine/threonine-protein phosphatase 2A activator